MRLGPLADYNGLEKLLIERSTEGCIALTLDGDERLEGLQRLDRSFEADRSRLKKVVKRGLSHDGPDEIASEDVRPDLLAHQLGRLASQRIHLQRLLQRPQIEFRVPAERIEFCKVLLRELIAFNRVVARTT
jgi:hypothetical protein